MEITIFARFHSLEGKEEAVALELRDAVIRIRIEPACLGIEVYSSVRDPRLFWLHSRWVDEAAFDKHVERPETNQFVEGVPAPDRPSIRCYPDARSPLEHRGALGTDFI